MDQQLIDLQPLPQAQSDGRPLLIAGPCSAESLQQVLDAARALAQCGVQIFRAGVWKPRTMPGSFQGMGDEALPWLTQVKRETGMAVATEVATPQHVEAALQAGIDVLWIGARTTADPFAVQLLADALQGHSEVTVLVKNPVNPDLDLWTGALQRLYNAGLRRLGAVHRGFSVGRGGMYRNDPQWHIPIELRRRFRRLTIVCDPSHMGGRRDLIAPISQQALDMGFSGLMIECHCSPDQALSDPGQQLTPARLRQVLQGLTVRKVKAADEELSLLRRRIDACDDELVEILNQRMAVSRQIGQFKKQHNMPVVQTDRYSELVQRRVRQAEDHGMDGAFMQTVLQAIHEESVRQQVEIFKKK